MQQKGLSLAQCSHKLKALVAFLTEKRDDLVKQSIDTALEICKEQGVPVEERRVRRKKRMAGENAEDAGLTIVEEVRRCMFEALNRYKIEAERRFNGITQLNDMFAFLNPHELLQNKNHETCFNALRAYMKTKLTFRS